MVTRIYLRGINNGKFLSVKPIGKHRFNDNPYLNRFSSGEISREEYLELCKKAELNNYEKSELKDYVDDWFNELKKNMPQENTLSPNEIKETTKDTVCLFFLNGKENKNEELRKI